MFALCCYQNLQLPDTESTTGQVILLTMDIHLLGRGD